MCRCNVPAHRGLGSHEMSKVVLALVLGGLFTLLVVLMDRRTHSRDDR